VTAPLMRILFISNAYPNASDPHRGVFNGLRIKALARNHDVAVIAPVLWTREWSRGRPTPNGRTAMLDGVPVVYPRYFYPPKCLRTSYGRFMWWSTRRTVERVVSKFRPDAIIGFWAHPDGEIVVRAAKHAGIPSVVIVGGSDVLLLARSRRRLAVVLRVLRAADAVVVVSEHLKAVLVGCGLPEERISVIRTGVDPERFCPGDRARSRRALGIPHDATMLLWVANLVAVKAPWILVEACARLKARGLRFEAYMIGDGPERARIARMCAAFGLERYVTIVGPIDHADLPDWYRAADLTVLTSDSEGVPNVLLEAMACGGRFVATRVGGIPEIADRDIDRLVEAGAPDAMAEAIEAALHDSPSGKRAWMPRSANDLARQLSALVETLIRTRGDRFLSRSA
jgi:teichuronic acid biosynthesis glycosyltransferase TuaC